MSSGFVSEADLAEKREFRKQLWTSTRKDGDPEEPPEEPETLPDHRSLFHRLEEQKVKKQEDWDEAHKLKNMVRGLEDDEVEFLDFVDTTKLREEKRIKNEESFALKEYRQKVAQMQPKESSLLYDWRANSEKSNNSTVIKKKSQLSLLAGAIKRKNTEDDEPSVKKLKVISTEANQCMEEGITTDVPSAEEKNACGSEGKGDRTCCMSNKRGMGPSKTGLQCIAILPGLGIYTDSSDSETREEETDSETDEEHCCSVPKDLTGRVVRLKDSAVHNH